MKTRTPNRPTIAFHSLYSRPLTDAVIYDARKATAEQLTPGHIKHTTSGLLTFRTIWDDCYKVANTPTEEIRHLCRAVRGVLEVEDIIATIEDETGRVNILFLFVAYITEYDPSANDQT